MKSYGEPMFANSISLYEPINQYKPIADCIGLVDGPLVHMSYPGLSFIKIPFPTRMTVIQLSNGDSWLHSPIAYQAELANAIEAMGPIRHIVSPNKIHYAHVQEWKAAFPDAITWASPGVRERARSQGIAVHFDRDLSQTAPQQWEVDLLQTMTLWIAVPSGSPVTRSVTRRHATVLHIEHTPVARRTGETDA